MICQTRPIGHVRGAVYSVVTHIYYFYTRSFSTFVFFLIPFFSRDPRGATQSNRGRGRRRVMPIPKNHRLTVRSFVRILARSRFPPAGTPRARKVDAVKLNGRARTFHGRHGRSFLSIDDERFFGSSPSCTPVRFIA